MRSKSLINNIKYGNYYCEDYKSEEIKLTTLLIITAHRLLSYYIEFTNAIGLYEKKNVK